MLTKLHARITAFLKLTGLIDFVWVRASCRLGFGLLRSTVHGVSSIRDSLKGLGRWARQKWCSTETRARSFRVRLGHTIQAWAQTGFLLRALLLKRRRGAVPLLKPHVVMLVVSDVRVDPRVQKSAMAAVARGLQVTVVAPSHRIVMPPPLPPDWGPGIEFVFPDIRCGALLNHHYPWLVDRDLLAYARRFRNVVFHAHDLNTALMAIQLARETGSACIADFHEWFSENVEWSTRSNAYVRNRLLKRLVMRRAELICLRYADAVVTVCESIARELQRMHFREDRVHIVRNIPDMVPTANSAFLGTLRAECGVTEEQFLLLWQGGIGPSRLLEPVIQSLQFAPGVVLAIRGPGLELGTTFRAHYEEVAERANVRDRLRLLPPVPSRDVVAAADGADAGVWTLPNLSKNFYYALPNKIFEYLAAGLPVIVANFPEAAGLVARYDVGLSFDPYDPASIAATINALKDDRSARNRMSANTAGALADMDAGREWSRVADLYQTLIERPRPLPA